MKWFVDLSTRLKLIFSFGLMVLLLLLVAVIAYYGLRSVHHSQEELFQKDFQSFIALIELRADLNRVRAQLLEMIMVTDRERQK